MLSKFQRLASHIWWFHMIGIILYNFVETFWDKLEMGIFHQSGIIYLLKRGYNKKENMILILDVARFKYPAHWVSLDSLWSAMLPIDPLTNSSRGWICLVILFDLRIKIIESRQLPQFQ